MRLMITAIDLPNAERRDVLLEASPDTPLAAIAAELGRSRPVSGGAAPVLYVDRRPLDPDLTLRHLPIRDGTVVSLDDPGGCPPDEPAAAVELRVTGGPDAGAVHRLPAGTVVVGRGPRAQVRVADPHLADEAFALAVRPNGDCLLTLAGWVRGRIDGEPLAERAQLRPGAQVAVGGSLFSVARPASPDAVLVPSADGAALDYDRPPRVRPAGPPALLRLPARPRFALPGRRSYASRLADYEVRRAQVEAAAARTLAGEHARLHRDHPDPASVLRTVVGPRTGLWERRRDDPDYLALRVGTGAFPRLVDVPVVVPLRERGVLGVAGPGSLPRTLGRWLVAQAAALHSPLDLRVCVLTDAAAEPDWEWVRWLPHARPGLAEDVPVAIGNDAGTVMARVDELAGLLAVRRRPDVLVVLDGTERLCLVPDVVRLLRLGPAAGIHAICLDEAERRLPAECQALVTADGPALRVRQAGAGVVPDVRPDLVGAGWCQRLARGLAPLRDAGGRAPVAVEDGPRPGGAVRLVPLPWARLGHRLPPPGA
jgi:DNA segregation ATPase FtsK/SpoIIIE, S-DNA-T family